MGFREFADLHDLVPLNDGDCIPWSEVSARCRTHPEEAARPYNLVGTMSALVRSHGPTVLHAMLIYDPPPAAVSAVLHAFPGAADVRAYETHDREYYTPLDLARRNGLSSAIARVLGGGRHDDQVGVASGDGDDGPTLHELVPLQVGGGAEINFEAVIARCGRHPEEASRRYGDIKPPQSPTVLHVLLMNDPPLEAVRAVVDACPSSIDREAHDPVENDLVYPFQVAVLRRLSPPIIQALIVAYFGERHRKDDFDDVDWLADVFGGLEYLDSETFRFGLETIPSDRLTRSVARKLMAYSIKSSFGADRQEWTEEQKDKTWGISQLALGLAAHGTINPAVLNDRSRCFVQIIYENTREWNSDEIVSSVQNFLEETKSRDRSQFSARNSAGRLPLHVLLLSEWKHHPHPFRASFLISKSIKLVVGGYPEAARISDPLTGDLPLHTALRAGLPYEDLLRAEPRALRTRSTKDRLYPFEVAMLRWGTPPTMRRRGTRVRNDGPVGLDAAYTILREEPSLLGVRPPPMTVVAQIPMVPNAETSFAASPTGRSSETKRRRQI